jgi:hypothetical protein
LNFTQHNHIKKISTQQLCINITKIKQAIAPQTQICTNHVHSILARAINWTLVVIVEVETHLIGPKTMAAKLYTTIQE